MIVNNKFFDDLPKCDESVPVVQSPGGRFYDLPLDEEDAFMFKARNLDVATSSGPFAVEPACEVQPLPDNKSIYVETNNENYIDYNITVPLNKNTQIQMNSVNSENKSTIPDTPLTLPAPVVQLHEDPPLIIPEEPNF